METTFIQIIQNGQIIEMEIPISIAHTWMEYQKATLHSIFSVETCKQSHQPIEIRCVGEPEFGVINL